MTSDLQSAVAPTTSRLERLCQVLAGVAVLWALVAVVLWFRRPAPLEIAVAAVAADQVPLAVEGYLVHLARQPQDWRARLELAALLEGIDPPQALVELRKIPPDADVYRQALRQVAGLCLAQRRDQEAKATLLTLEAGAPGDQWVQRSLAQTFYRQGELALALHHAQRSAALEPAQAGAHFLVAELCDELERHADMVAPLRTVIDLQPENYAAHLNLCYAYTKTGQPDAARREALWCLTRQPKDFHARRLLATAARDEGRHEEANSELRKALELAPEDINCRLLEAELLLFDRQAAAAFQRLQPLYERYPNELRLVALLAQTAAAAGQSAAAEKYRQRVQEIRQR